MGRVGGGFVGRVGPALLSKKLKIWLSGLIDGTKVDGLANLTGLFFWGLPLLNCVLIKLFFFAKVLFSENAYFLFEHFAVV